MPPPDHPKHVGTMKHGTRGGVVDRWETSVVWLAGFIVVCVVAGCAYLFLAPTDASGSERQANTPNGAIDSQTGQSNQGATTTDLNVVTDAEYGKILVNAEGHALYRLDTDPPNEATCTDTCAAMWPPATVIGTPTGGSGIDASKLGTVARENGTQITYAGHPLYLNAKDLAPRDRNGEGAFRVWWLVGPDGQEITAAVTHTTVKPAAKSGY